MSSIVFCIQSLNNISMISIRKCSIRVIRWRFFFKPRPVIFLGRRRLAFFLISIVECYVCFFPGWLIFSLPIKWKHAGVGRNTTSVELERKNLADLHCKYLPQHRTKKHHLPLKNIIGQRLSKNLRNVGWKISVVALQRPISSIVLCIQSLNNIWMMSIRKCSNRVIRWCFFFKPRSVIFPSRRRLVFFPISIGESYMCFY